MVNVDIAVFAYNESHNISNIISNLKKQSILFNPDFSVKIYLLANGCTDNTVELAQNELRKNNPHNLFELIDLSSPGKSRTWNFFVHHLSRPTAKHLVFCDSDIDIPNPNTIQNLIEMLDDNAALLGVSSKPIKDIVFEPNNLNILDKIIAGAGGTLNDWRHSLCGQLYVLRTNEAKNIFLPIGLPVEDGFIRAMLLTDCLANKENINKLNGKDEVFHVYKSERTITQLIKHQVRIVIGSTINATVFSFLRENPTTVKQQLKISSEDEQWLKKVIDSKLPSWRYGWVHPSFLFKRVLRMLSKKHRPLKLRNVVTLIFGFLFDLIVYIISQVKMALGTGSGHW